MSWKIEKSFEDFFFSIMIYLNPKSIFDDSWAVNWIIILLIPNSKNNLRANILEKVKKYPCSNRLRVLNIKTRVIKLPKDWIILAEDVYKIALSKPIIFNRLLIKIY